MQCRLIKDSSGRIRMISSKSNQYEEIITYSEAFDLLYDKYLNDIKKTNDYVNLNKKEMMSVLREYYRAFPIEDILAHPSKNSFDYVAYETTKSCIKDKLSKVKFKPDSLALDEELLNEEQEPMYDIESEVVKFDNEYVLQYLNKLSIDVKAQLDDKHQTEYDNLMIRLMEFVNNNDNSVDSKMFKISEYHNDFFQWIHDCK